MTFLEFVVILVIALFIGSAFFLLFSIRGPWGSFWTFFIIILLGIWAAEIWVNPVGPIWWNVAWVPLFFVGIIIALILAAVSPSRSSGRNWLRRSDRTARGDAATGATGTGYERRPPETMTEEEASTSARATGVFWIILVFLAIAIIIGFM